MRDTADSEPPVWCFQIQSLFYTSWAIACRQNKNKATIAPSPLSFVIRLLQLLIPILRPLLVATGASESMMRVVAVSLRDIVRDIFAGISLQGADIPFGFCFFFCLCVWY